MTSPLATILGVEPLDLMWVSIFTWWGCWMILADYNHFRQQKVGIQVCDMYLLTVRCLD